MRVHATLVKRGQAVARCSLEDVQPFRIREVPLWMLDAAACCKIQACKCKVANVESLRELKALLQPTQWINLEFANQTQHPCLLDAGGAYGGIDGPAEIEPTPVVCSSAMQPALDRSDVRCPTKNGALAGAAPEAASRGSRGENRRGGAR